MLSTSVIIPHTLNQPQSQSITNVLYQFWDTIRIRGAIQEYMHYALFKIKIMDSTVLSLLTKTNPNHRTLFGINW